MHGARLLVPHPQWQNEIASRMKTPLPTTRWSRRKLLRTVPALCASAALPRVLSAETSEKPPAKPFSTFTDVAQSAGLTKKMVYGTPEAVTYIIEEMGGGCAFFDYDNDGWLDIFIVGGRTLEGIPPDASNRLYKNNRDGTFKDVTKEAGLWDAGWGVGVCVGDFDNDGFEDLFVTYYGQNKLYRNNGNGTFTDVTEKAHLSFDGTRFGAGCTFLDYNRDGLLDLFVSNYVDIDLAHAAKPNLDMSNCTYEGVAVACGPRGLKAPQHYLYRNNGDGTFTDVSKESGIAAIKGSYGLTAVSYDVDEDGWPDIFVACDTTQSLLLMNNHDGTFREEGLLRGVAISPDGKEMAGMGIGVGDYDLDGHLDIVKTHFQLQACRPLQERWQGRTSTTWHSQAGLTVRTQLRELGTWPRTIWITMAIPTFSGSPATCTPKSSGSIPNCRTKARACSFAIEVMARLRAYAMKLGPAINARHVSRGCAFGDFDNDGDLDIVIMNQHEPPSLLRNDAPKENHWIKVRLEGTKSNRSAIGARVLVRYGGKTQAQAVMSQASYMSSNDPRLHFGLGTETTADIEVVWPVGTVEKFAAQSANQLVTILEGHGIVPGRPFRRA